MATDSIEHTFRNPNLVSGNEPYEIGCFAAVNGISEAQVRELIKTHGEDVTVLVAEARKLREAGRGGSANNVDVPTEIWPRRAGTMSAV